LPAIDFGTNHAIIIFKEVRQGSLIHNAKEIGMAFILSVLLMASFSFATVTIGKVDCPDQFEGRVKEILDGVSTGSAFSTHMVIFKNLSTIKGKISPQMEIEMLEHGPFELEVGEDYHVQLRNGRVCWVEKI
jgi:hypothetical protein